MEDSSKQFYSELYRGKYTNNETFFILPAVNPTPMGIRECLCERTISSLPPILVIRLTQPQHVEVNQLTLDLNELLPTDNKYQLFGVTLFREEHYTALCYSQEIHKWIYYRSVNVTVLSQFSSPIIAECSYILFYRKETIPWESPLKTLNSPPHETQELINLTPNTTSTPFDRPTTPNHMLSSQKQPHLDALSTPPPSQQYSPFHQHILHTTGPSRSVPPRLPKRKTHVASVCSECGIELHSSNIARHRLTHQFPCQDCKHSFSTNALLQQHREKVHPLGIVYECSFRDCTYSRHRL